MFDDFEELSEMDGHIARLRQAEAERDRWKARAKEADRLLRRIERLNQKCSLHGMIPCDEIDEIMDEETK